MKCIKGKTLSIDIVKGLVSAVCLQHLPVAALLVIMFPI